MFGGCRPDNRSKLQPTRWCLGTRQEPRGEGTEIDLCPFDCHPTTSKASKTIPRQRRTASQTDAGRAIIVLDDAENAFLSHTSVNKPRPLRKSGAASTDYSDNTLTLAHARRLRRMSPRAPRPSRVNAPGSGTALRGPLSAAMALADTTSPGSRNGSDWP